MSKVLTIREPFATLIAEQIKHIETRSWKTNYRGTIYIHAAKSKIKKDDSRLEKLCSLIGGNLNYGNIIARATLSDCIYMDEEFIQNIKNNNTEYLCGYYSIGRYAWIIDNVTLIEPIPCKGQLGIWNYKGEELDD